MIVAWPSAHQIIDRVAKTFDRNLALLMLMSGTAKRCRFAV
jgi:hypothetical protein